MKQKTKNAGRGLKSPEKACDDSNCPFHGNLSLRGRSFSGKVVSTKMSKTVKVEWERRRHIPKYERYEKVRKKVSAHLPGCIALKEGDQVQIKECRPLSKTKNFCVVGVIK